MSGTDHHDASAAPPPRAADLLAVGADDWAWFLTIVRAALHELSDEHVTPEVQRLRASPASRLAGGRMRQALVKLLAEDGPVWRQVRTALAEVDLPATLTWLTAGAAPPQPTSTPSPAAPAPAPAGDPELVRKLKDRARSLREERDEARRQLEGAEARAEALEAKLAELSAELDRERERTADLEREVAGAEEERARAVDRERRRNDSRVAELEGQLQAVRRQEEDRRQERARRERAREAAEQRAREEAAEQARRKERRHAKVVPGRPTRLPARIGAGTREEAAALLGPGRLVLLDGYNITLNTQPSLSLEEQRRWLVRLAEALASRLGVRPTVVFDGGDDAPVRPPERPPRGVTVLFSAAGVTADDEIDMAVAATDEPVVVVTDDRELRDRVRPQGADLLRVDQFLWVAT